MHFESFLKLEIFSRNSSTFFRILKFDRLMTINIFRIFYLIRLSAQSNHCFNLIRVTTTLFVCFTNLSFIVYIYTLMDISTTD